MKTGLHLCNYAWPQGPNQLGATLKAVAQTAESAGFDSLWVIDHFFAMEPFTGTIDEPMLEGYSTLTYLAAVTERIQLGTLVTGVIYRNPGFLIKQVTGLDVLSGGRAWFGVGAAWFEREAKGYGFPFPPIGERFEWLEEVLQIAKQMWSGDAGPYHGKHFSLEETLCNPMPLTQPHPPIMIGGMGEKKTLKLVARYADACNFTCGEDLDLLTHKLDVLRRHCDKEGRDYDTIEKTVGDTINLSPGNLTASDIIKRCDLLAKKGVQHVIFNLPNVHEIAPIETFGREILPEVRGFSQ